MVYSNDDEENPFLRALDPPVSNPALLYSAAAVAAGHLARNEREHQSAAHDYYVTALRELNTALNDPNTAGLHSTLGACLLLCVYEVRTLCL